MGRITSAATCSLNMWYAILTCLFLRVESGSPTDDQQHTMSHMNHHLLYSTSEIQIIGVLQQRGCLVGVPDSLAIRRSSVCVPIYLYRSNSLLSQYPTPESNLDGVPPGPLRIFTRCLCQAWPLDFSLYRALTMRVFQPVMLCSTPLIITLVNSRPHVVHNFSQVNAHRYVFLMSPTFISYPLASAMSISSLALTCEHTSQSALNVPSGDPSTQSGT
jgi:hypothetical protein